MSEKERHRIRVAEYGLIEILADNVDVIWGLHNTLCGRKSVKRGYVFNSLDIVGFWHDVVPHHKRKGVVYFRRIGDSIPHNEVVALNLRLGVTEK